MRMIFAVPLLLLANSAASNTEIVIADYAKEYEHSYKVCNVFIHDHVHNMGFLYALCDEHTAPPLETTMERQKENFYGEVWINGVHWDNCVIAYHETHDTGREFFRFECNRKLTPEWVKQNWYID